MQADRQIVRLRRGKDGPVAPAPERLRCLRSQLDLRKAPVTGALLDLLDRCAGAQRRMDIAIDNSQACIGRVIVAWAPFYDVDGGVHGPISFNRGSLSAEDRSPADCQHGCVASASATSRGAAQRHPRTASAD